MNYYIIAGHKNRYDEKEWNLEEALKTKILQFNDYVPLITKLKINDKAYIREYGNGIINKATIEDIILVNNIYKIFLKNLHDFDNPLRQRDYFDHISNQNKRSRLIQIYNPDVNFLEDKLKWK